MRYLAALIACLLALPAWAEDFVTAPEFQALSEGRTLYFSQSGQSFGAEQYFENRESLWLYGDGTCTRGQWYSEGDAICFSYEDAPTPQCWYFTKRGKNFFARLTTVPAGDPSELRLSGTDQKPLDCPAPGLGV